MSEEFNYGWLETTLSDLAVQEEPARVHGSLVGYLSAGGKVERGNVQWFARLLDEEHLDLPDDLAEQLDQFCNETARMLALDDLRFAALIPEEHEPLQVRAEALVAWCGGFLGGVGLAGFRDIKKLSGDAKEAFKDLERIAKSELEFDDNSESDENALMELCEFVKIGAAVISQEIDAFGREKLLSAHQASKTLQ